MSYSIIIPTYNHLDDCLKPCIESLINNSTTNDILVVANGCTDGTKEYLERICTPNSNIRYIWNYEQLGYIKAVNLGLQNTFDNDVILLNNDTQILSSNWVEILSKPFHDNPKTGITSPVLLWSYPLRFYFAVFFCAMISRKVINEIGLLDEDFGIGTCDDVDYSYRALRSGYDIVQVPEGKNIAGVGESPMLTGQFPIYHAGSATLSSMDYKNVVNKNMKKICKKYINPLRLNLGCGNDRLDGYVNVDGRVDAVDLRLDARDLSLFDDNSVDEILTIHMIEHIHIDEIQTLLKEWRRVLKPDGKLCIECPNMKELCKEFVNDASKPEFKRHMLECVFGTNDKITPHLYGYDYDILKCELEKSGFYNIVEVPTQHHQFNGNEYRNIRVECTKENIDILDPSDNKDTDHKVYDCFPFYNELELLKIRLEELNDVVDYFVIVECNRTHSNKCKPLYYYENKDMFKEFEDKIVHLYLYWTDDNCDPWKIEYSQRDYAMSYLRDHANDYDIIISGDADEIPRASTIKKYKETGGDCNIKCLDQIHHYYYMNCKNDASWPHQKIGPWKEIKKTTFSKMRYLEHFNKIENGGWHFSFLGGPEAICTKIEAYAHREYDNDIYNNLDNIKKSMEDRVDLYHRDSELPYYYVDIDESYPKYILENHAYYEVNGFIMPIKKEVVETPEISILLPTCGSKKDELESCIHNLYRFTDIDGKKIQLLIYYNGDKVEYFQNYFSLLKNRYNYDFMVFYNHGKVGCTDAINKLIDMSRGKYIVPFNDDAILTSQSKNQWINMLKGPFEKDESVGITGCQKYSSDGIIDGRHFFPLFCGMIKREVIDNIGKFDPKFNPGFGEDIDFCYRAEDAGYKLICVSENVIDSRGFHTGTFPIYHPMTQSYINEEVKNRNIKLLKDRYDKNKEKKEIEYSIIIPTYNHLEDCFKPCIKSILKYTDFSKDNIELIIVANGCNDGTIEYCEKELNLDNVDVKMLVYDEPLGYPKAINAGIKESSGKFVILFNNDNTLLSQEKNDWIYRLRNVIDSNSSKNTKYSGIKVNTCPDTNEKFLVFFLVMISRDVFEKIGLLDENFKIGYGEDIDFCIRARKEGIFYSIIESKDDYPLFHKSSQTVHDVPGWDTNVDDNRIYLKSKHLDVTNLKKNKNLPTLGRIYSGKDVTVVVSTKDRYFSTLPLLLQSIINQTEKPREIIIFDDGECKDLREVSPYNSLFKILSNNGVNWKVIPGCKQGQVANYKRSFELCETEWIWRLDDDNSPQPDVLSNFIQVVRQEINVAAVGGMVYDPNLPYFKRIRLASSKIEDIYLGANIQWFSPITNGLIDVDHIYSTFMFRRDIGLQVGYPDLSEVGFREETIFTYEMKRLGYDLIIDPKSITWHLHAKDGGTRNKNPMNWENDGRIFAEKMREWNITPIDYKFIVLDCGLGDHYCFKNILPEIIEKYKDKKIIIASCYDDVFIDWKDAVNLISIEEAGIILGDLDKYNVYSTGWNSKDKKHLMDLFRSLYL